MKMNQGKIVAKDKQVQIGWWFYSETLLLNLMKEKGEEKKKLKSMKRPKRGFFQEKEQSTWNQRLIHCLFLTFLHF